MNRNFGGQMNFNGQNNFGGQKNFGRQQTPAFGNAQAPTFDGNQEAPTFDGNSEPPTFDGNQQAPTFDGNQQAPTFDGNQQAPTFDGNSEPPTFDGNSEPPTFDGNMWGNRNFAGEEIFMGENNFSIDRPNDLTEVLDTRIDNASDFSEQKMFGNFAQESFMPAMSGGRGGHVNQIRQNHFR